MRRRKAILSVLEEMQVIIISAYIVILSFVALAGIAIALYKFIF